MNKSWTSYKTDSFFDELITPAGKSRQTAKQLIKLLQHLSIDEMRTRRAAAELAIKEMGVSFTIYSEEGNIDRAWPFDIIPGLFRRVNGIKCDWG